MRIAKPPLHGDGQPGPAVLPTVHLFAQDYAARYFPASATRQKLGLHGPEFSYHNNVITRALVLVLWYNGTGETIA